MGKARKLGWLTRTALVGLLLAAPLNLAEAQAQQREFQLNIPSQPLGDALRAYALATGEQIVFTDDLVAGRQAPALRGEYSAEGALGILLRDTGLVAARTARGGVMILREGDPRASDNLTPARFSPAAFDETMEEDVLVVTGTRIRAGDVVASPVYSLTRDDFAAAGANSVQQMLRTLPQNFNGGSSETSGAVSSTRNGADGNVAFGAGVNLRGLGAESTLVLLNGRRMAPGGFGNLTDVSTIPLSAVERIDVMPDGASAIYGSDAVGGVVNFVLRDDFQGGETRLRYGAVTDGGLTQTSVSQVLGATWTTGSVLINVDYGRNAPLLARDRPFATGLQAGEAHLSPEDERIGFLINGHQDINSALTLSAVAYGVVRDASVRSFDPFSVRQDTFEGTTTQFGGTLALEWRIGENWTATLAHTQSQSKNDRLNFLGATSVTPAQETGVTATHDAGATQIELEGALFAVPGGDARLAFGAERRAEELFVQRSAGYTNSNFEREVSAGYAELYVPLIGAANANALAQRLSVTLAGRYEDYDDVGSADTYKLGVLWSPIEHLNLRATYGTSFRAPYLYQYDTSLSGGLIFDMPNPNAVSGVTRTAIILQMPDANLGPENATIWSAGFDVAPQLFGLRISGTYFDIAYEDRVSTARLTFAMFTDPALLSLVSMPPDPELLDLLDEVASFFNLTPGDLSTVEASFDGRIRNQASTEMSGIDLSIGRDFEARLGAFQAGISVTKLLSHDVQTVRGAPTADILDTIFNPVDLRARASLTWQLGGWSAAAFVNYADAYEDNQLPGASTKVSSWTTIDLGVAYTFREEDSWLSGLRLGLNAFNVFDEDPPRIADLASSFGNPGYDTENANPIGRLIAFEVSKRW